MDYNQILAQQQAALNQAMQNYHTTLYGAVGIQIALFILGCFVVSLFYVRLRAIADELRRLRIAYEFAHTPRTRLASQQEQRSASGLPEPANRVAPAGQDAEYMPKQ